MQSKKYQQSTVVTFLVHSCDHPSLQTLDYQRFMPPSKWLTDIPLLRRVYMTIPFSALKAEKGIVIKKETPLIKGDILIY